ncbi:Dap2 protein [Starmerella bacillaris]|uniref:Dap2 protein n=1 Tax=Starmerella bacillaris TaxID=1247836 RepID=A0AAV5RI39_STABA|nr:Dap2 protein [Starmerella bacillaris]
MTAPKYERVSTEDTSGSEAEMDGAGEPLSRRPLVGNSGFKQPKRSPRLYWVASVAMALSLVFILGSTMALCIISFLGGDNHEPQLTLAEWRAGKFANKLYQIDWTTTGTNGELLKRYADGFYTGSWAEPNGTHTKVAPFKVSTSDEEEHVVVSVVMNNEKTHTLLKTDVQKHWRHSSYSSYWIYDVSKETVEPLSSQSLSVAEWSPDGKSVAYVYDHNVYLYNLDTKTTISVTSDGGPGVFNGIPDWVYEEEVFAGDSALWWSPDGKFVSYMRTNDTSVPEFPIPYFFTKAHGSDVAEAAKYPEVTELKYPKPGFPNPQVEFWVYNVDSRKNRQINIPTTLQDPVISEVVWVGKEVVIKMSDRVSDHFEVWVANPGRNSVIRSRVQGPEDVNNGWFEVTHNIIAVGDEGYIDTIDVNGYNHLAFFSPASASIPRILTSGNWEVNDLPIAVNKDTRHVYFHSSVRSSMERSINRVSLDTEEPINSPDFLFFENQGVYTGKFSGDASYAVITYSPPQGPLEQYLVSCPADLQTQKKWTLQLNNDLKEIYESRNLISSSEEDSLIKYYELDIGDGITVNVREIRPTNFKSNRQYPVLFFNYGGPGSQQILKQLTIDFQRVFAEEHNAIVLTVDPRGTGNRGRAFRDVVRDHIGVHESDDVIAVAKIWNNKNYVDESKTAIWGWSYGGYLTLKTLERDLDLEFKYGVAVAPVTDWSYYDSIYTERYMHTPETNPDGYAISAISNVTNIARHNRFMIMHGTGDDNVHFQNTLTLLDKFDLEGIENYDVHVFPDSDHSISFHNANIIVYDKISEFLAEHQK